MTERIRQGIRWLSERLEALSLRERVLVALAMMAVVIGGVYFTVITAQQAAIQDTESEIEARQSEIDTLVSRQQVLTRELESTGREALEERLDRLEARLRDRADQLESLSRGLIGPQAMARALRDMLEQSPLDMRSLATVAPEPLTEKPEQEQVPVLYRHGLEMEFEGSYADIEDYFRRIEELDWTFYWEGFELETVDYPLIRVRCRFYTLSLESEWIGT